MKKISLLFYIISIPIIYAADLCHPDELGPCGCNISIERNFFNDEIIGFYLSSIDLESGESSTLLFDYAINLTEAIYEGACNPDGHECPSGFDENQCNDYFEGFGYTSQHGIDVLYLDFHISMFIPDFMDSNTSLVDGRVRFDINSSTIQEINFRNTDLNFDTTQLAGNTSFTLESHDVHITDETIEEITNLFLSQGRAPNGVYTFNFTILDESYKEIDSLSETVEVFVPSFLDLITPGSSEIADSLSNTVMSQNPIFQWNSDYCNKCDFFIRVSEFRVTDHSSLEEALDDYSVLPLNNDYFELSQNTNTFQYPSSGVGELYPGKMYVWQIMRTYMTSNGINEEFSPIYLFKIQSQDVTTDSDKDINLENLKLFLGSDTYENLFSEEGALNGYNSVSTSINVDNQSLSINYLLELIAKKNQGNLTIIEVNVE